MYNHLYHIRYVSVVVPHVRFLHMGESTEIDYKLHNDVL